MKISYRAEVDGLRGIAIILIVAIQLIVGGLDNLGVITINENFRILFHV